MNYFFMFGSDFLCVFIVCVYRLMEDPHDEDSECSSSDADNDASDDSSVEEEGSCKVADCNDNAPRTLNRFRKRRQIV